MADRCQIPSELRKPVGATGINKQECLKISNACWEDNPLAGVPNCYKDNGRNPCSGLVDCTKNIGEVCYRAIWDSVGCSAMPPPYNEKRKMMSYKELQNEANYYATSNDKYHFNACYGVNRNKINYCNASVSSSCNSQLNKEGDIITCNECEKYRPEDGGKWLFKDGKRIWLPSCTCPAAVKAAELTNTIKSNICGHPVPVAKPVEKYKSKEVSCNKAWAGCSITEDCCAGRQCRKGDKRCLTQDEFNWANWVDKTNRDGTILSKHTVTSVDVLPYKSIKYGDLITLRSLWSSNKVVTSHLASCGYDIVCKGNQGVATYQKIEGGYIHTYPSTGRWRVLDSTGSSTNINEVKYGDNIILQNEFSGWILEACGSSTCWATEYRKYAVSTLSYIRKPINPVQLWSIRNPDQIKGDGTVVKQGDSIRLLNLYSSSSWLNVCGNTKNNCGAYQFEGVATYKFDWGPKWGGATEAWSVGIDYEDVLINGKEYEIRAPSGKIVSFTGSTIKLYPANNTNDLVNWRFVKGSDSWNVNTFYLQNTWRCETNEGRCDQWISFTGYSLKLYPKDNTYDRTPWEFIQAGNNKKGNTYKIKNKWRCSVNERRCNMYIGLSGDNLILTSEANAVIWTVNPRKAVDVSAELAKYQTSQHLSDCSLLKQWNNPETKWFYGGNGIVSGATDSEIFYTTPEKVVVVPSGTCEVKCGAEKINICDQLNYKITNCKSDLAGCRLATTTNEPNPFTPTNVDPKCFYSIPIEIGEGVRKSIDNLEIRGLKCSKSDLYNPGMVDAAIFNNNGSSQSGWTYDIFKGSSVYRMKMDDSTGQWQFILQQGYPKGISEVYVGVPNNIDACIPQYVGVSGDIAFSTPIESFIFFKDSLYYKYNLLYRRVTGQGKISSIFVNVPNSIDAAIPVYNENKVYFLKGNMCYTCKLNRVIWGGPGISNLSTGGYPLYLVDGNTNYSIDTQSDATNMASGLGGILASLAELEVAIKEQGVKGQWAAWTSSDEEYSYYAETSNKNSPVVKCGSGSCLRKGGTWCRLDPNKLTIGYWPYDVSEDKMSINDWLDGDYTFNKDYQIYNNFNELKPIFKNYKNPNLL